jgi:hypothetical protein
MFGRLFSFTDAVNISAYSASVVRGLVNHKLERDTWRSFMNMVINIWVPRKMRKFTITTRLLLTKTAAPLQAKHAQRGGKGTGKALPIFDPAALSPGKTSGRHYTGGWMGFGSGPDGPEKSRPPSKFETRTVHVAASSYTH